MGKIFDIDSPLMRGLTRLADVMWLNILVTLFAIPLFFEQVFFLYPIYMAATDTTQEFVLNNFIGVIMIALFFGIICSSVLGPALTGMHYVLLKMVRDEDSYVTKSFFKSYKENFKQGAILQMLQFMTFGVIVLDFILMRDLGGVFRYLVFAVGLIIAMASLYIFPLLAKFENTIPGTIKNAFLMSVLALPKTIAMLIVTVIPVVLFYFFNIKIFPLLILFGIAGPGILCAFLYNETFKRFEPKEEVLSEEEELSNAISKLDDESEQDTE
ncbi:MAG: DUF624 domain-containing protein [Butyrivibrio sp.]|nr:DUF624 domain-containing protein [Butyrivibrio sp.]